MFLLVTLLSWADYQYFTEGYAHNYTPMARQAGHIAMLAMIIPAGYLGWKEHSRKWIKEIWLHGYLIALAVIIFAGAAQYRFELFSISVLDGISSLRLFFCSPVPYFMLYILSNTIENKQQSKA